MAFFKVTLIAALVVAAFAEPLRYRRQTSEIIESSGAAAAEGQGSSHDAHNAAVVAIGIPGSPGNGWGQDATPGVPAAILIGNSGNSGVSNDASILEVTSNDGAGNLAGLQTISVGQLAGAQDNLDVEATGGEVALGSSSDAGAEGSGASAAAGNLDILVNQAGWGMGHQ